MEVCIIMRAAVIQELIFFIDYLPKGTFIIEYPVKVNASGMFSLGTSTVQCMYAPEFGSHTKGEKIYIGK